MVFKLLLKVILTVLKTRKLSYRESKYLILPFLSLHLSSKCSWLYFQNILHHSSTFLYPHVCHIPSCPHLFHQQTHEDWNHINYVLWPKRYQTSNQTKKARTPPISWTLNPTLLENHWINEEIKETKIYLKTKDKSKTLKYTLKQKNTTFLNVMYGSQQKQ